jgi:hypothetical protein
LGAVLILSSVHYVWAEDEIPIDTAAVMSSTVSLGYRAVSTEHNPNRAAPHSLLKSGPTADLELKFLDPQRRFILFGNYLNESDYLFSADFDNRGLIRVNLESEKLFHNLDHLSYDRPDASDNADRFKIHFVPDSAEADYSVEVGIDQISLKAKLPSYPVHLTLGYWRLQRSGHKQMTYFNENPASDCTVCHMTSKTRKIDRVTEEVTLGLDTHVGYLNFAVEQLVREFRDREEVPYDSFGTFPPHNNQEWAAGRYPHDDAPDSRLVATTFKTSTSPSGGLVASAGFTIGKKENLSDLGSEIYPIEAESDFRKGCADLTYTPHPKLTLNFRYRMLDQSSSTPSQLWLSQADPATIDIRQTMDLERATYFAKLAYRPLAKLTLMAEYERKDLHRSQTGPAVDDPFDPYWELPEDENINRYRISFISRPVGPSTLRLTGWYEILTSDDPAYGISVENQQQFFTGINWTPTKRFGMTGNLRLKRGVNTNFSRSDSSHEIDRTQHQEDVTFGLWSQLTDALSLNLHYGYLRSDISQDVIFGTEPNDIVDEDVAYRQRVHTTTVSLVLQLTKKLKALAEGRYIRSQALFDPDFPQDTVLGFSVDSSALRELSELEITQAGVGLGLEWELDHGWSYSARFSYDDYEDRNSSNFDGTAQMYMFNIARAW